MWSRTLLGCWFAVCVSLCMCAPQSQFYFPDQVPSLTSTRQPPRPTNRQPLRPTPRQTTTTRQTPTTQQTPTTRQTPTTKKPETVPVSKLPLVSNGKSAEMCKKYSEMVKYEIQTLANGKPIQVNTCVIVEPLITVGAEAKPKEFPHMALLGFPGNYRGAKPKWSCGGSVISERYILSAAHCNSLRKVKPKWVKVGDYNFVSDLDDFDLSARTEIYDIEEWITHPDYDEVKQYNDIALYKVDKEIVFSEYVRPICLHTEYELPRDYFIITGWGNAVFGQPSKGPLMKGNITYISGDECGEMLDKVLKSRDVELRDNAQICAANFVNGTDTCQGDSGGPMQYPLAKPECMYSQVGITSYGIKCGWTEGEDKYPAVYTRVSYFVPWIESIVWK